MLRLQYTHFQDRLLSTEAIGPSEISLFPPPVLCVFRPKELEIMLTTLLEQVLVLFIFFQEAK